MNTPPTALKRQTKETLVTQLLEANEERSSLPVRYLIVLFAGVFIGYALAVY